MFPFTWLLLYGAAHGLLSMYGKYNFYRGDDYMEEMKIYLSAFAFAVLAALKMAFPSVAEDIRTDALSLLSNDKGCIEAVEAMGRRISEEGITQELITVFKQEQTEKKAAVKINDGGKTAEQKTENTQINIINLNPES